MALISPELLHVFEREMGTNKSITLLDYLVLSLIPSGSSQALLPPFSLDHLPT